MIFVKKIFIQCFLKTNIGESMNIKIPLISLQIRNILTIYRSKAVGLTPLCRWAIIPQREKFISYSDHKAKMGEPSTWHKHTRLSTKDVIAAALTFGHGTGWVSLDVG